MTEELEIKNAKITNVSLSMADHGCLTFYVGLNGGGWCCNFGGYCIGHGYLGAESFQGSEAGLEVLMRIMDTVGVECWEDLKGQYCRVKTEGWGGKILSIGNILKDKWFDIKEFYNTYNETHTFDNNELLDEMDLEKIALDYSTLNSWAVRYYIDKYENAPLNTQLTPSGIVYSTTDGVDTITSLEELTDYIKEIKRKENISEF
jgi:hypothetical protein